MELEALDIADDTLELEGADEAENEELAKKLLDDQGRDGAGPRHVDRHGLTCSQRAVRVRIKMIE